MTLKRLVLPELKVFEEFKKYSFCSSSSLLAVKFISVQRRDSAFLGALLAACSLFKIQPQLLFQCIDFFKKTD
jgi:hypothetical protein